jgi:hypothetical protein
VQLVQQVLPQDLWAQVFLPLLAPVLLPQLPEQVLPPQQVPPQLPLAQQPSP